MPRTHRFHIRLRPLATIGLFMAFASCSSGDGREHLRQTGESGAPVADTLGFTSTLGATATGVCCDSCCDNSPPVAVCKNVEVLDCNAAMASIDGGSYDPDPGDVITCTQSPAGPYLPGVTTVTLTCTDPCGATSTCQGEVTVADTTPPVITCPDSQTFECAEGPVVATFAPTASDDCSIPSVSCVPESGSTFPVGNTTVTCTATDSAGNGSSCTFNIDVQAAGPPVVTTTLVTLWPPDHDYHDFSLSQCVTSVVDPCDGTLDIDSTGRITRIESDETEDANGNGDGNTCDDAEITGNATAILRSEREGTSDGRVYTVYFEVTGPSGNVTESSCTVQVPHDQSGPDAVNSGCQFCTGSGCGTCPTTSPLCP